jgi:hypothetical protein
MRCGDIPSGAQNFAIGTIKNHVGAPAALRYV